MNKYFEKHSCLDCTELSRSTSGKGSTYRASQLDVYHEQQGRPTEFGKAGKDRGENRDRIDK